MPQHNKLAVVSDRHPYCNDIILDLVQRRLLSKSKAGKITKEQFESSALAENFVLELVYQKKMTVIRALTIKREDYFNSGLSSHYIQNLVERNIISIDRALSIHRDEMEDPINYLTELGEKRTEEQNRKLVLYEADSSITPNYVEHIISLEFQKKSRDLIDERELELLHDSHLRKYAIYITNLEFFSEKTPKTKRELELIFSHHSRPYFDLIIDLEFNEDKSIDDEIYLENLYLRVCCKLPRKNAIFSLFQGLLRDDAGPRGCHEQVYRGGGFDFGLIQHDASERRLIEQMKAIIHSAAKEIVMTELDVRAIPVKLRETEAMKTYVLDKTDIVRHALMKYFVGHHLAYSRELLDSLKEKMIQKITAKDLTLSHVDRLLSLRNWIDEVACVVSPD